MTAPRLAARATPLSEIEKAIIAAERQGLKDYRIIRRGRQVIIEVRHSEAREDLDAAAAIERAMGR